MNWISFISGCVSVLFAYALFTSDKEKNEIGLEGPGGNELIVNSQSGRYVTLSCQTCRKIQKHTEIEDNLYQCTKCERHVDLRRH
ncbi:hypothetical protein [Bacillus salipaludis]|uniref:hypothetical protein n=1 Tax=Bacillus salipaludis TaxID=2547811 RepID=UPI002E1A144B|nr:hypothetical protein [Bacillus salipaludis]